MFLIKHIEDLCDSKFWDDDFLYSKEPNLTQCFQNTVIKWTPCFIFWFVLPFWIYMLTRSRTCKISITWLLISKMTLSGLLIISEIAMLIDSLIQNKQAIAYKMTPILLIVTYSFVLLVVNYERYKGLKSSVLLFTFWLFSFIGSLILLRTAVLKLISINDIRNQQTSILICINFTIILVQFVLSCLSDKCNHPENEKCNVKVSLLSKLIFWSANTLIYTGYKRQLNKDDFDPLEDADKSDECSRKLLNEWNKSVKKYKASLVTMNSSYKSEPDANTKFLPMKLETKIKEPSFGLALLRTYYRKFIAASALKVASDLLVFVGPIFLNKIIDFIKDKDQSLFAGYFLIFSMFFFGLLQTFLINHFTQNLLILKCRVSSACMGLVYRKSIILSSAARRVSTLGEMVNLMSENIQVFREFLMHVNLLWTAPLQIAFCIYMLWKYLGSASLAGLLIMVTLIPINAFISNKCKILHKKRCKLQDKRIKITSEVFSTIKIVKFYSWESSFEDIIRKIKTDEINILFKIGIFQAISSFSAISIPFLVAAVSFATFILMDEKNELDSNTAFVSLSLFNIIKSPLTNLPHTISSIIQTQVQLKRLQSFFLRDEIVEDSIEHFSDGENVISLKNATFGWDKDTIENAQLKEYELDLAEIDDYNFQAVFFSLTFKVAKNKLVAVVGRIGTGKSSLLSALLSEMHKYSGYVNVYGKIAYVSQIPWIQNATFKENILFGDDLERNFYEKCIEACALNDDLNLFEGRDETEIGEKGVNLSGGQKSRVSLARAIYSKADVYLLDDPLSSVDVNVSKHIFKNVIGPKGMLKNKTRIFVTNSINYLPVVDEVIILDNGRIVEMGKYDDLMDKKGALWQFINLNKRQNDEIENFQTKFSQQESVCSEKDHKIDNNFATKAGDYNIEVEKKKKKEGKLIMEEHVQIGKVKMNVLLSYFKACRPLFTAIFFTLYVFATISQVSSNLWLSDWSNDVRREVEIKFSRNVRLIIFTCIGLGHGLFTLIGDLVNIKMSLTASDYFHTSMLKSMLQTALEFFEKTPIGRIINRFNRDIDAIERAIPDKLKPVVRSGLTILSIILTIIAMLPWFAIPTAGILVIYFFCQRFFASTSRQLKRIASTSKSPIFSNFSESLNGISIIRAYNKKNQFISKMNQFIDQNIIYTKANLFCNRWLALRLEVCGHIFTLFVCIFAVINRDTISPGVTGMVISLALSVTATMTSIVRMAADFESNITSIERIHEYQETPHEDDWKIEDKKPNESWPEKGVIKFSNYAVRYRINTGYALKGINCEIKAGEKIGIVGRTGAGKSSLTLALFRLLKNYEGDIFIDGIDIHSIGLHDLRKKLTIIPQDPVIYSGTLKMNIDPFSEYSEERIWQALNQANMKEFVQGLDKQLDFECSEGGDNLSVGQRQLICLVRAILRKTKIIILDEATASVDHNTDDQIQKTIRQSFNDCTILTIAHRINTITDSDRVMVLDKGEIVEFDSPYNLLQDKTSRFYSLSNSINQ